MHKPRASLKPPTNRPPTTGHLANDQPTTDQQTTDQMHRPPTNQPPTSKMFEDERKFEFIFGIIYDFKWRVFKTMLCIMHMH